MKKIALTLVALLSLTAASAQNSGSVTSDQKKGMKQMTPEQRVERMAKKLKLTDEQKSRVLALDNEYADVLKAPAMRGPRPPRKPGTAVDNQQKDVKNMQRPQMTKEQKAEMKQHFEKRKEYDAKLKQILTDTQYQQLQKMQPHHGHQGHHAGAPDGPLPEQTPQK